MNESLATYGYGQGLTPTQPAVPDTPSGGFTMKGFGQGMQGFASLAGALSALQQSALMKKQYNTNTDLMNRNLENQALLTNDSLAKSASMRAQMHGKKFGTDAYNTAVTNATKVNGEKLS